MSSEAVHPIDQGRWSRASGHELPARSLVRSLSPSTVTLLASHITCHLFERAISPASTRPCKRLYHFHAQVTGVARPVVTQVKDAAYYRPKAQGADGALWNDPSLHAPPVRQVQ